MKSVILVLILILSISSSKKLPNIIFLLSDDMGIGDVGFNNDTVYQPGAGNQTWTKNTPQTPNLDAMAYSDSSIIFSHFYAQHPVCSPTRASILTGRIANRDCISGAEGCGTKPAWSCTDGMPLPQITETVAEAVKPLGYATIHLGKWHLGDFWNKGQTKNPSWAQKKWPTSHPGLHGFDEWYSTEASAPSTTTNCGCNPSWKNEGNGCITGGGVWQAKSYDCTNYWFPTDLNNKHQPSNSTCHEASTSTRQCVNNHTSKIEGDDSEFIVDQFEDFLVRKTGSEEAPFLAMIWFHTNHVQHPSLPEYYNAYTDAEGNPAGDYLGTISQMDTQIGRVRDLLKQHNVDDNTMIWYTADNGAHTSSEQGDRSSNQASHGLRQCKASLFQGGIREPGIIEWPGVITKNRISEYPVVTSDFLPTVMEVLGLKPQNSTWAADGMSILGVLNGSISDSTPRTKPMVFMQGKQVAVIDGDYKMVHNPEKGQCKVFLEPYGSMKHNSGPFLFNLKDDPTESKNLENEQPEQFAAMKKELDAFVESVKNSQYAESNCKNTPPEFADDFDYEQYE